MKPLPENSVIHCPTKELDQIVCKILDDAGLKTIQGKSYSESKWWQDYGYHTCYNSIEGCYGDLEFYQSEGFTILPAEDFIKMNEVEQPAWVFQTDEELIAFVREWRYPSLFDPSFLEEKRKPKFSLICADGVEVNDPEQEVWTIGEIDHTTVYWKYEAKKVGKGMCFSTKEAAQLHLKKTILEKNGISKEDCEMIFRPSP